jgi:Lon protease-like protein
VTSDGTELPMFPLGSVLLPTMLLPLHVFEPRYRRLTDDVLAADRRFGVVLIERGHEVGGGDVRTEIGTVAEVLRAERLEDGRWLLVCVGTERMRVTEWLPDAPYPRARVLPWPDAGAPVRPDQIARVADRLERVLALAAELGAEVTDVDLVDDPVTASWQATALAPIGPLDAQRLLAVPDAAERLARLLDVLADREEVLRFQLRD